MAMTSSDTATSISDSDFEVNFDRFTVSSASPRSLSSQESQGQQLTIKKLFERLSLSSQSIIDKLIGELSTFARSNSCPMYEFDKEVRCVCGDVVQRQIEIPKERFVTVPKRNYDPQNNDEEKERSPQKRRK